MIRDRNFTGAKQDLSRSEEVLTNLLKDNANNLTVLRDLAECHRTTGDLAVGRSNWPEAQREYQKSLDLWQRWPQIGTSSIYDQHQRDAALLLVRNAMQHIGKPRHS